MLEILRNPDKQTVFGSLGNFLPQIPLLRVAEADRADVYC